jgi:hypothetical protein
VILDNKTILIIDQPLLVLEFSQGSRRGKWSPPISWTYFLSLSKFIFFGSTSHGVGEMKNNRLWESIVLKKSSINFSFYLIFNLKNIRPSLPLDAWFWEHVVLSMKIIIMLIPRVIYLFYWINKWQRRQIETYIVGCLETK